MKKKIKVMLNSLRGPFIVVFVISNFFANFFHCCKLNTEHIEQATVSYVSMQSLWFLLIHNGRVTNFTPSW